MADLAAQGYSPAFDLPARSCGPLVHYMLAAVPRTGSSFLAHELWRTGDLGVPLEYLNFKSDGHYPDAAGDPEAQLRHWRRTLATRTTSNGVFGQKMFLQFLVQLKEENPALLKEMRPHRIVYLTRSDRMAHMISYARAQQSGVWTAGATPTGDSRYSRALLEQAAERIEKQERGWEWLFSQLGIDPLRVTYEEVASDVTFVVERIADYLGVELSRSRALSAPELRRQADELSHEWARSYRSGA